MSAPEQQLESKRIAIGSRNPVKIRSSLIGIASALQVPLEFLNGIGIDVPSGVPDQPIGDGETKLGALNRARTSFEEYKSQHDCEPCFSVGLEGGISSLSDETMECFAWIAIFDGKKVGFARTASFALPPAIRDHVRGGMELGDADDAVFGTKNAKQGDGTVGHLTNNAIDRSSYYSPAVTLAMIPFLWPQLYP